jgi:hypothetical protein
MDTHLFTQKTGIVNEYRIFVWWAPVDGVATDGQPKSGI